MIFGWIDTKYALAALQKSVGGRDRVNNRLPSGSHVEQHLRILDVEFVPVGRDGRRVHLDVGIEVDDERSERLGERIDEGRVVERRRRGSGEIVYEIVSM